MEVRKERFSAGRGKLKTKRGQSLKRRKSDGK